MTQGGSRPSAAETNEDVARVYESLREKMLRRDPDWSQVAPDDPRHVLLEVFAEELADLDGRLRSARESLVPRLLEALGGEPRDPIPASTLLRFVSAEDGSARVPAGTVALARRRDGEPRVSFETTGGVWVSRAEVRRVVTQCVEDERDWTVYPSAGWERPDGAWLGHRTRRARYVYVGDAALACLRLPSAELVLECPVRVEDRAEFVRSEWEGRTPRGWRRLAIEWDARGEDGGDTLLARIRGPAPDLSLEPVDGLRSYWLRCALPSTFSGEIGDWRWASLRLGTDAPEGSALAPTLRFPRSVAKLLSEDEDETRDHSLSRESAAPASAAPTHQPTVCVGLDRAGAGSLAFEFDAPLGPTTAGTDSSSRPQFQWEYSIEGGFRVLSVDDTTEGFTQSGAITWNAPPDWAEVELCGERLFWIRGRWVDGARPSPARLLAIVPHAAPAEQRRTLSGCVREVSFDERGRGRLTDAAGDGTPLRFETFELCDDEGVWRTFSRRPDDATENASASGFRLRRLVRGGGIEIELDPRWRGRRRLRFETLAYTHGERGSVPAESVVVIEDEGRGVDHVVQPRAASGGRDVESATAFRRRLAWEWGSSSRLVTRADFERALRALEPRVARVEIYVDPRCGSRVDATVVLDGETEPGALSPARLRELEVELTERTPLGTALVLHEPAFVDVDLVVGAPLGGAAESRAVAARVARFFDPLTGGTDASGLPTGGWLGSIDLATLAGDGSLPIGSVRLEATDRSAVLPREWRESAFARAPVAFPRLVSVREESVANARGFADEMSGDASRNAAADSPSVNKPEDDVLPGDD